MLRLCVLSELQMKRTNFEGQRDPQGHTLQSKTRLLGDEMKESAPENKMA